MYSQTHLLLLGDLVLGPRAGPLTEVVGDGFALVGSLVVLRQSGGGTAL